MDKDGKFVPDDGQVDPASVVYKGNKTPAVTEPTFNVPDSSTPTAGTLTDADGKTIAAGDSAHTGDKVTLTVPTSDKGYTATDPATGNKVTSITGTLDKDGKFVPDNGQVDPASVVYKGDKTPAVTEPTFNVPDSSTPTAGTLTDADGKTIAAGDSAHTSDKVTLTVPESKTGYTATDPATGNKVTSITGTLDKDGKFVPDDGQVDPASVVYKGDKTPAVTEPTFNVPDSSTPTAGTLTDADGKTIAAGDSAHTGDKVILTLPAPNGYTPSDKNDATHTPVASITGTLDKDGNFVPDSDQPNPKDIVYNGNKVDPSSSTVSTNKGSQPINIPAGQVGTTSDPITLPKVAGYDPLTVVVDYTPDGPVIKNIDGSAVTDKEPAKYVGVKNPGTTIQVTNPDGTTSNITIPEGHYGDDPVTVTADDKPGYKAPSVVVTFGADGKPVFTDASDPTKEINPTDVLTYKRISSGSSNHVVVPDGVGTIEKKQQTVATFSDKPDVEVYALDDNNKMSVVNDRILPHQTNWMSDESITIDGVTYYRVATNEWAKADQVYAYDAGNFFIRTYDDSVKLLYAAEGNIVQNRSLARSSSWMSDRTAYIIDGQKYYRVATNEFIKAEDVETY